MFVNEDNTKARPKEDSYGKIINQIAQDGVCPFCSDHLKKYHPNPLVEKKFWWLTDNAWPYEPKTFHKLLISKDHVEHFLDISEDAWNELRTIMREEAQRLKMPGGALVLRFGDTHFTGGSVSHLHAHLYQSNPEDPKYDKTKGILMRIG